MSIKGDKETIAALRSLKGIEGKSAVEAGAMLIRNSAAEKAPYRTGNLRRSLAFEEASESTENIILYNIGTNVEYAPTQEMLRPYLRPAFDEQQTNAQREIQRVVQLFLDKK